MKQNKPFSAKRLLSAFVALAMCLSLLPVVPAGAAGTIYVDNATGLDTNAGTDRSAPVQTFEKALEKAQSGDTIHIVTSTSTTQLANDVPLIINKAITVTGGQLTVNHAGIILGDNVTFQDMKLKLTNFVRNGILANGYTLKMSNVENVSQGVSIHLFAGGLSDILDTNSWKSSVPQTGSEGRIELDYKVNVGDIHGGGLSDISNSTLTDEVGDNTFDKPAAIVFGANLSSDSTLGTVYGGGAREVRGNQDQTADGNSLVHDFNLYQATGGVDIVVHNAISKIKIDGDTGPGQTQATVTYDATSQIPAALGDIQNISKLHVKQGNFNFKRLIA